MIYKAVVLENSMLFSRGAIRVRIAGHYNRKIVWNLEERFPDVIEEGEIEGSNTEFTKDYEAALLGSLGGGRNYGALSIPQPNEKGIVAFLGKSKTPVWLGSLFYTERDDDFNVEVVNFPSDKFEDGEDTDGIIEDELRIGDDVEPAEEKNIILRTKNTNINSQEEVDFQQQLTSNIITIGKRRVRLTHFPEDGWDDGKAKKYKDFIVGLDEENKDVIRLVQKDIESDNSTLFEMTEEHANISINKNGENKAKVFLSENEVEVSNQESKNKIVFNEDNEIEISNENGTNKIKFNQNGEIEIHADNKVILMGGGHKAVRFEQLIDIIEKFEDHIHISSGPGPTSEPMDAPGAPNIGSMIISLKNNLASETTEVE